MYKYILFDIVYKRMIKSYNFTKPIIKGQKDNEKIIVYYR